MTFTIFVPGDSAAIAVGANEVASMIAAQALQRDLKIQIIRNGTRGLLWLEPLVEVETPAGRIGFGRVDVADVPTLFETDFYTGNCTHPTAVGLVEEIPFLKKQQRLTFARTGITEPLSLHDYEVHGGYQGALAVGGAAQQSACPLPRRGS